MCFAKYTCPSRFFTFETVDSLELQNGKLQQLNKTNLKKQIKYQLDREKSSSYLAISTKAWYCENEFGTVNERILPENIEIFTKLEQVQARQESKKNINAIKRRKNRAV